MGASADQLHVARHPQRHRVRRHRADHAHARGRPRGALCQHRAGLPLLLPGARANVGGVRGEPVHVPGRAVRRRGVAGAVRQEPRGRAHALRANRDGHPLQAALQGVRTPPHALRALLREGALRAPGGPAHRRQGSGACRGGGGRDPRGAWDAADGGASHPLGRVLLLLPRVRAGGDVGAPDPRALLQEVRVHCGQPQCGQGPHRDVLAPGQRCLLPGPCGEPHRQPPHWGRLGGGATPESGGAGAA
mmetsp:Transcript_33803/g.73919  ORF Transcript_33803/g.73919 Transcript_33803/m.73919 type:complete len:247 (-) Transcript_33803:325-1065(-)